MVTLLYRSRVVNYSRNRRNLLAQARPLSVSQLKIRTRINVKARFLTLEKLLPKNIIQRDQSRSRTVHPGIKEQPLSYSQRAVLMENYLSKWNEFPKPTLYPPRRSSFANLDSNVLYPMTMEQSSWTSISDSPLSPCESARYNHLRTIQALSLVQKSSRKDLSELCLAQKKFWTPQKRGKTFRFYLQPFLQPHTSARDGFRLLLCSMDWTFFGMRYLVF